MTTFQEQYSIGTLISGTFSKLPFKGIVVEHIKECIVVQVENPHRNLPLGSRGLCFHPSDSNVTINEPVMHTCQFCDKTSGNAAEFTTVNIPENELGYAGPMTICLDCNKHVVHVSQDQAYPTLESYKAGNTAAEWEEEKRDLIASDSSLSPIRAGELAAAKLALQAGKEYVRLEEKIKHIDFRCLLSGDDESAVELYDWLAFNDYNIKRELIELSGTRTLLADMEAAAA